MYADLDTKMLLDADEFGRRGTDSAAAFLHGLTHKDDGFGYLITLSKLWLSSWLDYTDRNHIEKRFHNLKMRNRLLPCVMAVFNGRTMLLIPISVKFSTKWATCKSLNRESYDSRWIRREVAC